MGCLKKTKQNTKQFWLFTKCIFISFEMMPVRAEGEKETNTSQSKWQERNKNSCRSISQCKKSIIYTVSARIYMGMNIQKILCTESVFPQHKRLMICLTVSLTSKTNHCYKDDKVGEQHANINNILLNYTWEHV